jgi:hypothetical protein
VPLQIVDERNLIVHVAEFEADLGRRPLSREELQAFFDHCDAQVSGRHALKRTGSLAALRDAAMFITEAAISFTVTRAWEGDRGRRQLGSGAQTVPSRITPKTFLVGWTAYGGERQTASSSARTMVSRQLNPGADSVGRDPAPSPGCSVADCSAASIAWQDM